MPVSSTMQDMRRNVALGIFGVAVVGLAIGYLIVSGNDRSETQVAVLQVQSTPPTDL